MPISEEDIDLSFGSIADEVKTLSTILCAQLVRNIASHPWPLVSNCTGVNGLEAMRALTRR